ncbi:DUF1453 domain-containing protein [Amycolatopsis pithecellobii]|uniref:DUF1453 domain-containing protein n=1 Tax=Amycolatopsis pithecellobii TaxID=664692 RepID=A0A6N7YXZ3_9PSEU|nr:DUF1453 domain-containing protein [Amycolatopsis pithecellobii]MTD53763.1 DUF1453 domain-containing protein [Amycolatopsis pithecellobii]
MSGPVEVILIIAAIGYVLTRRLIGEPAEGRRILLLPVVLTGVGVLDLAKATLSPVSIGFLVGTTAISLALGLLRGASIRVFEQNGVVFLRYTATTVVLWAVNLGIKLLGSVTLGLVDPMAEHAAGTGLMFTLGVGMVVEGLAVLAKAMRSGGRIVWQKGRNGQPHATSSLLDGLQQKVRATDWSQQGRRRRGGGLASVIEDVRALDFRQPNNGTSPYDGPQRSADLPIFDRRTRER